LIADLPKAMVAVDTGIYNYTDGSWYEIYRGMYDDNEYFFQFGAT